VQNQGVEKSLVMQGRPMGPAELEQVRGLLAAPPDWSRYRLSRDLCRVWNWRRLTGQIKDMAARALLLKLEQRGWVALPARRHLSPNRMRHKQIRWLPHPTDPIVACLSELQPLPIQALSRQSEARPLFDGLLHQYHYLGYTSAVGQNVQYLVRDRQGRDWACWLLGAAAWKTRARDDFIGWTAVQRQAHLGRVANNRRFLILPWVRVPELASHILGRVARRIATDWLARYGQRVALWETFVERGRFRGSCYRAANWICVGQTQGRTRQDRPHVLQAPVKDVGVYPLQADFRKALGHEAVYAGRTVAPGPQPSRSAGGYYPGLAGTFGATGTAGPGVGRPTGPQQFQPRPASLQRRSEQTLPQEFACAQRSPTRRPARSSGPDLAAGQNPRSH
jgi:hypothetical protein